MEFEYDHKKSLGYLTGLAHRLLSNTLAARFQVMGVDMTAEQWGAVIILLNEDAVNQGRLGEQLYLEKSSVSRLVDGLERREWIERKRDPKDSRQKFVIPTPKVMETAERCAAVAVDILNEAQRGTTEEERSACLSFLLRVITNLNGMKK